MQKLIKIALIAPIASLLILAISALPSRASDIRTFIAVINAGQEVPPNTSDARGVAFMVFDERTNDLCFAISYDDLESGEIAAHFHSPAPPGENAGVVFGLPDTNPKNGCVGPLNGDEENDLKDGLFYINIHSNDVPGGEIRGQVVPVDRPR